MKGNEGLKGQNETNNSPKENAKNPKMTGGPRLLDPI